MSYGIKPYDFVQQVYYMQEKTILDFWPDDDKYKEVLVEANLVLQELQNVEDWTWLRDKLVLGPMFQGYGVIPEFDLPDWVYKPSTLHHDAVRLHKPLHGCRGHAWNELDQQRSIAVPIASTGDNLHRREVAVEEWGGIHFADTGLRAVMVGQTVTFNKLPNDVERRRIAVMDVQRRIPQFHVCTPRCKGANPDLAISYERDSSGEWLNPCAEIEPIMLTDVPDPNYVILSTASRHAEGSPPAQSRISGLQDAAQRILSAMRSNDAAATDSDWQDWETPGYIEVI